MKVKSRYLPKVTSLKITSRSNGKYNTAHVTDEHIHKNMTLVHPTPGGAIQSPQSSD